jgi:twitching motility protein PilT
MQGLGPIESMEMLIQRLKKTKSNAEFLLNMEKARFRVSVLKSKGNYGMVLRQIPNRMFGLRDIGLPDKIRELLYRPRGLILVTGPTGSGKSTTLASMINYVNENRDGHIITIEDPIEYYHNHKRCVVTQREVHVDVPSFSEAIRRALRQDPDIILVGEMRDLETIEAAISAAETGHLVFGTLHTNSAAKTVDRIVDAFPANMKDMIRTQLASSLVAVISQVLCKKIGGGRVAGYEIMVNTSSIASLIRENKTFRITSDIQTGANLGMITMDTHLMNLVNRELVSPDEVLEKAQDPVVMRDKLIADGRPPARGLRAAQALRRQRRSWPSRPRILSVNSSPGGRCGAPAAPCPSLRPGCRSWRRTRPPASPRWRRAPLELSLVAEDDVLQALGPLGVELRLERGLSDELVAEDDVALQDAAPAPPRGERPLVLDRLAGVVEEDAGHRQVRVDLGIEGQEGLAARAMWTVCSRSPWR